MILQEKKRKKRLTQGGLLQVLIDLAENPKFKCFKAWVILRETSGFFLRIQTGICFLRPFPQILPEAHKCCKGKPSGAPLSVLCCRWAPT